MEDSILKSTKKILGISPDDDSFDLDVITHINSAFSVLTDLGIGPDTGFAIADDSAVCVEGVGAAAGPDRYPYRGPGGAV